jgi:thiol-disulfide isomerase/thioredoxin
VSEPPEPAAPRRIGGALLAALLVTGAAGGGFVLYRLTTPPRATLRVDHSPLAVKPPAEKDSPPAEEAAAPVRRIPEELPAIRLPDLSGHLRGLSDFRGRVLIVNFWATWCEPCRREIPLLQNIRRERAKDGIEIVGIALDHRADVAQYARARDLKYPLLIGENGGLEAANALGMDTVLPFSVFADRTGRIITLKVGELHPDEAALILDRMTDLDQGRLTLAAAREQIASGIARLAASRTTTPAAAAQ